MSNPKKWGPLLWKYLHLQAHSYPNNPSPTTIKNMLTFYRSVGKTLPCMKCRKHFNNIISKGGSYNKIKIPPLSENILKSKKSFTIWLYHVHNYVTVHVKSNSNYKLPSYRSILRKYN